MKTGYRTGIGAALVVAFTLRNVPDLRHGAWGEALLLFAALVVVPLAVELVADTEDDAEGAWLLRTVQRFQFSAALLLVVAYVSPPGIFAVLAAAPWAAGLFLLAAIGVRRLVQRRSRPVAAWCRDVGLLYAAVGAVWVICDRVGFQPLGFDPSIVLLTAVHFHYAGLLLPVLTHFALTTVTRSCCGGAIAAGVIGGVPAVAVGITASQFRLDPRIEMVATLLLALSGLAVAWLHLRLATQTRWPWSVRLCWLVSGVSLGVGMGLAALYGIRHFSHQLPWLDIPWMRALHGSLNALGFGFFGVLGWRALARQKSVLSKVAPGKIA